MRAIISGCAAALLLCAASGFGAAQTTDTNPLLSSATSWDVNGDGIYTCDEWKVFVNKIFERADKNHDGYVDAQEFKTIQNADPLFRDADLSYFDDNHDRRLSRSEFVDKPSPFFARYDKNHDCRVTPDEIKGTSAGAEKSGANPHARGRGSGLR
jgi:hypothetical protein